MGIIDTAKDLIKVAQLSDNADIIQQVFTLQREALEMQEELNRTKEELRQLQNKESERKELTFKDGLYWKISEGNEDQKEGPYCSKCMDVEGLKVNMQIDHEGAYACPNCSMRMHTEASREVLAKKMEDMGQVAKNSWGAYT